MSDNIDPLIESSTSRRQNGQKYLENLLIYDTDQEGEEEGEEDLDESLLIDFDQNDESDSEEILMNDDELTNMLDSTKEARSQLKTGGLEEIGADFADFQDNLIASSAFKKTSKKGVRATRGETRLPDAVKDLLGKANSLYINRDYGQAIALLQETITKYPNLHQPWNTLGLVHEEMGNKEKALQVRMVAAHMSGNDAQLWKELGLRSIENNANQQAIYCFSKALLVDPLDVDALWDKSFLQKEMGLGLKAMEGFQQILNILPYHFKVINELAQIYRSQGETKKAIQLYEEAMEYHIKHQHQYQEENDSQHQYQGAFSDTLGYSEINMLSELYLMLNDYRRALDCIKTGIRHVQKRQFQLRWLNRPDDDDEYLTTLNDEKKKKKKNKEKKKKKKSKKNKVRRSKRNLNRNKSTTVIGDDDDDDNGTTKKSKSIMIDSDSDDSDYYDPNKSNDKNDSSDSDEYNEDEDEEEEDDELSQRDSDDQSEDSSSEDEEDEDKERLNIPMELRVRMGVCRIYLGQPKVAGRHFEYLYHHEPTVYPDLYQDVACAYMDRRFYKLALPIFQKIINAEEEVEVDLLVKTADCYRQTGDLDTAVLFYINVLDEQPDNLEVMTSLALVYEQQGKEDEAFELANFVVEKTRELKKKKKLDALAASANKGDHTSLIDHEMKNRNEVMGENMDIDELGSDESDEFEQIEVEEHDMETGVTTTSFVTRKKEKKKVPNQQHMKKQFASLFDESAKTAKSERLLIKEKKRREEEAKLFKAMDLYDAILNLERDVDENVVNTDVNIMRDYIFVAQQLWDDFSSVRSFYERLKHRERQFTGFFAARKPSGKMAFSSRAAKSVQARLNKKKNPNQTEIHSESEDDDEEDDDDEEEDGTDGQVIKDPYTMTHFRNILIDDWIRIFINFAYMLTVLYRGDEALQILKTVTYLKVCLKSPKRMNATMLAYIGCSLLSKNKSSAIIAGRWFCNSYIFNHEGYKIYNIIFPGGFEDRLAYASQVEFKFFRRQIMLMDKLYMLYEKQLISNVKDEYGDSKMSDEAKKQIAQLYDDIKTLNTEQDSDDNDDVDDDHLHNDIKKERLNHDKNENENENNDNNNINDHSHENEDLSSLSHLMKDDQFGDLNIRVKPLEKLDTNLLANFGNINALGKNYGNSITYYLRVYAIQPKNALNNLCLAVAYLQRSTQRTIGNRHFLIIKAMQMLSDYCKLRKHNQESEYNMGRAFHTIGLTHLAVRHYEKALTLPSAAKEGIEVPTSIKDVYNWPISDNEDGDEDEEYYDDDYDETDLKYEAAYNLHLIYMTSGATSLAQVLLLKYCTI